MLDRYLRYADAGDQFVGRTIALVGYLNSWRFAALPPHFVEDVSLVVLALFPICRTMPNMIPVLTLALASVVYHATKEEDCLAVAFEESHELKKTALFQDKNLLASLKSKLNKDMYASDRMTATGIPPFVCLFMQIADIPSKVKEVFMEVLRSFNVLPRADESRLLETVMAQLKVMDAKIDAVAAPAVLASRADTSYGVQAMWNSVTQRFSVVPAEFTLPCKVLDAFTHWHCKTTYGRYVLPPLRTLTAVDFRKGASQCKWSEVVVLNRYLFERLTPELRAICLSDNVSPQTVQHVFGQGVTLALWPQLGCKTASKQANRVSNACKLLRVAGITQKRTRKQQK